MENKDNIFVEELKNLPSSYFKIASLPLPDIIFDEYQEIRYDKSNKEIINKCQPIGWDKEGVWVGIDKFKIKNKRKRIVRIKETNTSDTYNDIKIIMNKEVAHIYSLDNNNFNEY